MFLLKKLPTEKKQIDNFLDNYKKRLGSKKKIEDIKKSIKLRYILFFAGICTFIFYGIDKNLIINVAYIMFLISCLNVMVVLKKCNKWIIYVKTSVYICLLLFIFNMFFMGLTLGDLNLSSNNYIKVVKLMTILCVISGIIVYITSLNRFINKYFYKKKRNDKIPSLGILGGAITVILFRNGERFGLLIIIMYLSVMLFVALGVNEVLESYYFYKIIRILDQNENIEK